MSNLVKTETVDLVQVKIKQFQQSGEIHFPSNYSPENALKSAWLKIQEIESKDGKKALETCTKESIANAMLSMVIQGLNVDKSQGYFIVYGKKLVFQRSYFGTMAIAKTVDPTIGDIVANIVYEGDTFKFRTNVKGKKEIVTHEQDLENIDNKKIKAAYAVVLDKNDNIKTTEIMTMEEIKTAWKQSKMYPVDEKGNIKTGTTHDKFTADMAKKTVINKILKPMINSSNDSGLFLKYARESEMEVVDAELQEKIEEEANTIEVPLENISVEPIESELGF